MSIKFYQSTPSEKFIPHDGDEPEQQVNDLIDLKMKLKTVLQMPNIMVLAGSGTSLGKVKGPSMSDLWISCIEDPSRKADADKIIAQIEYDLPPLIIKILKSFYLIVRHINKLKNALN